MTNDPIPERLEGSITLHLVPAPVWETLTDAVEYQPEGFAEEGFVHCTDSEELVIEVANRYYRADTRAFLVLDVDLDQVSAPARYEDPERLYPHVYGPIERHAVVRVRRLERLHDGTFTRILDSGS